MTLNNIEKGIGGLLIFFLVYTNVAWTNWFLSQSIESVQAAEQFSLQGGGLNLVQSVGSVFMVVASPILALIIAVLNGLGVDYASDLGAEIFPFIAGLVWVGIYLLVLWLITMMPLKK